MQIKDIAEFMGVIARYYGGFPNDFAKDLYAEELAYIKPSDYSKLFAYIISNNPASWRPDVKALKDGIKALKIDTLLEPGTTTKCRVCGTTSSSTGVCPRCKYSPADDGDPAEYRKFWKGIESGEIPRLDFSGLIADLYEKKRVTVENDKGAGR